MRYRLVNSVGDLHSCMEKTGDRHPTLERDVNAFNRLMSLNPVFAVFWMSPAETAPFPCIDSRINHALVAICSACHGNKSLVVLAAGGKCAPHPE